MAEEKSTNKTEEKKYAHPYADVRNPFSVDSKGSLADYILLDPESIPELALGASILVEDTKNGKKFWSSGRVNGLKAISPFNPNRENLLYMDDNGNNPIEILREIKGPHTHQPIIIQIELDQELSKNEDILPDKRSFISTPIQRPPSASSKLFFPRILPDNSDEAPSLQEMLDIKEKGIPLGAVGFGNIPYTQDGKRLIYNWDMENLENKHIFIVGESGSGKTVLLKNLAYEIRKKHPNQRVILTDVQGDIVQLLFKDFTKVIERRGWQANIPSESVDDAIEKLGKFQLIIPAKKEKPGYIVALKKLAENRGIQVKEVGLRLQDLSNPSDVEYLYRAASQQVAPLLDEEAEEIKSNSGVVTIDALREKMVTIPSGTKEAQPMSSSGTPFYRSTYTAAIRALKNLGEYFDFHQPSMASGNNPLDCLDFDGTSILFLDHLTTEERIMWEMQLVNWLYRKKSESWEAFVFFDEAHQIVPAYPPVSSAGGTFDRLRMNFERLAREGRKFGINLVLSTQSPKDLHEIVPEQCPTKIIMKISPRNAKYAFLDSRSALIANRFGHGQFWIQSPFNGTPEWIRIHSWAPPLPHEKMATYWDKIKKQAQSEN